MSKLPVVQHARLGASKAHRWMNCPGSIRLSQGIDEETTVYALEGRAAHELAERTLSSVDVDAADWLDDKVGEGREHEWTVDEEMAEAVQVYVNYVRERAELLETEPLLETRFDLSPLNPPGEMFGTADCVLVVEGGRFIEVVDYKHGIGVVVDATENAQLMYYALGALVALQQSGRLTVKPQRFKVTIVQPRAFHPDGPVRSYVFDYEELVGFKNNLFERAAMTLDEHAPLQVGDWCRFCPAQAVCPEQERHAIAVAQSEFDAFQPPAPEHLSLDQLVQVLDRASIVEDWIRSIRGHVQQLLEAGEEVPGWKLVPRRARRKWKDEKKAAKWAEKQGVDPYKEAPVKSPAQIEKALKAKLPRGKKTEGAKKLLEESKLVVSESSGNTIAPTSDARPAVSGTAAEDEFTALPSGSDN